ncbi:hypothetical protein Pmani_002537 [Petrolisthes manimaculis]|uniref:HAT C-terminal dimerisation domain-containing protein n=1 Tax=Petrolisthes manimaculis TaxID=1843537 RepID=A0AAE1QHS3_9EUCA|nr:hypothetical protein Pmani_002537 [Petrolisthes manimaculis]
MLEPWGPLQMFFTDLHYQHQKKYNATLVAQAYEMLHDPYCRLYYCFLDSVLQKFTQFNLLFQSECVVITSLHGQACELYKDILLMYMNRDYVMKRSLADVDPGEEREFLMLEQVYLGASVLKRTVENVAMYNDRARMKEFRLKCRSFLVTAAKQVKKRYDFGDPVLSRLSMLDPAYVVGHQGVREQSLVPLASCLPRIIEQDDLTLQKQDDEWRRLGMDNLPEEVTSMAQQKCMIKEKFPDKFWGTVKTVVDDKGIPKYECVAHFALAVLSLPHSNADCERCFSDINRMKSKDRNRLKTDTIRDVLLAKQCVHWKQNNCTTFTPSRAMLRNMNSKVLYPSTAIAGEEPQDVPDIYID